MVPDTNYLNTGGWLSSIVRGLYLFGVVALLILAAPLVAADVGMEVEVIENTIYPGQLATYELLVTNNLEVTDRYSLESVESRFILFVGDRPEVAPGETARYPFQIRPAGDVGFGSYLVPMNLRSRETGERERVQPSPLLSLRDPEAAGQVYSPSIALSVDAPVVVDPREDLRLTVHMRNRNARSYEGDERILVRVSSDFFEDAYLTSLGGVGANGERSTERIVAIDDYQPPGNHTLVVELIVNNRTVSEQQSLFRINAFSTIEQDVLRDRSFFKTTTTMKLRNDGNVNASAQAAYPANILSQLFISSSHNYAVEEVGGERSLVAQEELAPLGEASVTYVENYRLLVLLLLLAVASVIGYFALRSPLVLGKEAEHSGDVDEGKSEIKVRLFLKNRSSQTLRNLRVIDRISGMADVQESASLGTLKPSKVVKKKAQGTLIRWDLDSLEPFEERIITYRVHTPLTLVGDVTLPNVKVKFDDASGRERTSHSNEVVIGR